MKTSEVNKEVPLNKTEQKPLSQKKLPTQQVERGDRTGMNDATTNPGVEGDSDHVLLKFPFSIDKKDLAETTTGLVLNKMFQQMAVDSSIGSSSLSIRPRTTCIEIRAGDYKRLDGSKYLNDTLVDFIMQWYVAPDVLSFTISSCFELF
jgi:hypothetical protein